MAESTKRVTLIGDVVGSRDHPDRSGLQRHLVSTLRAVNELEPSNYPLRITVGDEFQASYSRRGQALDVAMLLRARLNPSIDIRFGIGRGGVTVLNMRQRTQDGPGWWAAREAIEWVKAQQELTGWQAVRTRYQEASGWENTANAINAALMFQDGILADWDHRTWRIFLGELEGETQSAIAEALRISRQAVQQRRRSALVPMIMSAHERLARLQ